MATRFYLPRKVPSYYPANFRGSWTLARSATDTNANFAPILDKSEQLDTLSTTYWFKNNSTTVPFTNANVRLISAPLSSNVTISGTLNAYLGTYAQSLSGRAYLKVYAYVTAGNSATVRGVLVDYTEPDGSTGLEFGKQVWKAVKLTEQTVSSVSALAGDRVVIELGSCDYTNTFDDGTGIRTGTSNADGTPLVDDLSDTNTDASLYAGWVEFSTDLYTDTKIRTSQVIAEILRTGDAKARLSQQITEVPTKGQPKARLSQFVFEVISRAYVPGPVLNSVTSAVSVAQSLTTTSEYLKTVTTPVSVDYDLQQAGTGAIRYEVTQPVTIAQAIDLRIVPLQSVTSNISVNSNVFLEDYGPHVFVQHTLHVTTLAKPVIFTPLVTDNITVNSIIHVSPLKLTKQTDVVVDQLIIARVYEFNRSIESIVNVADTSSNIGPSYREIKTPVIVSQDIYNTTSIVLQSALTNVNVAQTIFKKGPVPVALVSRVKILDSILDVGNVFADLQSLVHINQNIATRKAEIPVSVETRATVLSNPVARSTGVPLTVISTVEAAPNTSQRNAVIKIEIVSNIAVTPTEFGRNTNVRIALESSIGVGEGENESTNNLNLHQDALVTVNDSRSIIINRWMYTASNAVHVTTKIEHGNSNNKQSINNNVRIVQAIGLVQPNMVVTSLVKANQVVFRRSDIPRVNVITHCTVKSTILAHSDNPRQEVISYVTYHNNLPGGGLAASANTPRKEYGYNHIVFVNSEAGGFPNPRRMSVAHSVLVRQVIKNNQPTFAVAHTISVYGGDDVGEQWASGTRAVRGGIQVRYPVLRSEIFPYGPVSAQFVTVTSTASCIVIRNPIQEKSVRSIVFVRQYIGVRVNEVFETVVSNVKVNQLVLNVSPRTLRINVISGFGAITDGQYDEWQGKVTQIIECRGGQPYLPVQYVFVNQKVIGRNDSIRKSMQSDVFVSQKVIPDQRIKSNIAVTSKLNSRRYAQFIDKLTITETVGENHTIDISLVDDLPIIDELQQNTEISVSIVDHLNIPDDFFEKDTSIGTIVLPIVKVVRVDKFLTIQCNSDIILLPPAEWDDSEGVVGECKIQRSMNGLLYTIIKSTDRRKITYPFKLGLPKANELRLFLIKNMSKTMTITDWNGRSFWGYCTTNPHELTTEARYAGDFEKVSVELEFEAVKL